MATGKSDVYLQTAIMTAPPEKLQLMLYDGAMKFARQAREKILEKNYEASCDLLVRAQNVVLELICGLRPEFNPTLCARMGSLYHFVFTRLVEANMHRDVKAVDDALEILTMQRDIWLELLDRLAKERACQEAAAGLPVGT